MTEQSASPTQPSAPSPKRGLAKESIWEVYFPVRPHEEKEAIPIASFPMIIYFWPSLLAFFFCGFLQSVTDLSPVGIAWWAIAVFGFNLVVIAHDLDQKKFVIVLLLVVVLGLGAWISDLKGLAVVSGITGWIKGLEPSMSTHAYFLFATILGFFSLIGLVQPRFDYWRIEPNEFVHYIQPWGRDQSVPRQGSTITREVPDVLELLLTFGGGTLLIRREGQVVARIEHIPFLGRRMIAIERMLGATRVRTVTD